MDKNKLKGSFTENKKHTKMFYGKWLLLIGALALAMFNPIMFGFIVTWILIFQITNKTQ